MQSFLAFNYNPNLTRRFCKTVFDKDCVNCYKMGGCEEHPTSCTDKSCKGHEVDIMHFSIGSAIPGRLYGGNPLDNRYGNGGDRLWAKNFLNFQFMIVVGYLICWLCSFSFLYSLLVQVWSLGWSICLESTLQILGWNWSSRFWYVQMQHHW